MNNSDHDCFLQELSENHLSGLSLDFSKHRRIQIGNTYLREHPIWQFLPCCSLCVLKSMGQIYDSVLDQCHIFDTK